MHGENNGFNLLNKLDNRIWKIDYNFGFANDQEKRSYREGYEKRYNRTWFPNAGGEPVFCGVFGTAMSRKKEFRRRQRQSWLRFLRTVGPFVVLAILVATAFLYIVPPTRAPIPVFYVGFDVFDDKDDVVHAYPLNAVDRMSEAKSLWGGIEQNSLLLFCDIVGSTGNTNKGGEPAVPEVFIPATREDYVKALFDEPASGTWKPFFEYLKEITGTLSKTATADSPKYLVVALNVFHPDGPGGVPPQFNPFIKMVKDGWDEGMDQPPHIDLSVFLSHDFGQRNYQHSDPDQIGSHFKRTLDLYLQGDGVINLSDIEEITLDELNDPENGLARAVASSAARHELIQTPVLRRKGLTQQPAVRLGSPEENPSVGKNFAYRSRSEAPKNIDIWWQQLFHRIEHRHWEVENPFDLQRASLLLLKYERLWFSGRIPKADSKIESTARIEAALKQILGSRQTVDSPEHSLYDIRLRMARMGNADFDSGDDLSFDPGWLKTSDPDGNRPDLDNWKTRSGDRHERKAFEVWRGLASAPSLDRNSLQSAAELLSGPEYQFDPPVNELVFLQRLGNELPRYDFSESFMLAIQGAIKVRDRSNRFVSHLNPVLLKNFADQFDELENSRRVLEDRVFGLDEKNANKLVTEYSQLVNQYNGLIQHHQQQLQTIKEFNRRLIEAPHAVRFATEVLSNQAESDFGPDQVQSYGAVWSSGTASDAMEVEIEEIAEKTTRLREGHVGLFGGATDVYGKTDIVVDNPADVATDARVSMERLLLYWPGGFRFGKVVNPGATFANARQSVRQILNVGPGEGGIASERTASPEYKGLVELGGNGMLDAQGQLLLPMLRRVAENRTSRLGDLFGWPLSATAAKETHLSWPLDTTVESGGSPAKKMIATINHFHYHKSDFVFNRILKDFCGTPTGGKRYVDAALSSHNQFIKNGVLDLDIDQQAKQQWRRASPDVSGAGADPGISTWDQTRAKYVKSAEAAFDGPNFGFWKNKDNSRSSMVDELALDADVQPTADFRAFVQQEFYDGNRFLISIRSIIQGDVRTTIANPQQIDGRQLSWQYRKFEDASKRERELYLRGWTIDKELPDYKIRGESSEIVIHSRPKQTATPHVKIRYNASKQQKTITFLIDCSDSMKGSRWTDVKKQLGDVFQRLLQRQDIHIELVAFGATKNSRTKRDRDGDMVLVNLENGNVDYIRREVGSKWTKNGLQPIPGLTYPGDGGNDWDVIYYTGSNSLDELKAAIDQLQPFGETPLFAALFHAIKLARSADHHFFVVMSDGIDFIDGRRPNNGRSRAPSKDEPEYSWQRLTAQIEGLGRKDRTVEFNYEEDANQKNGNSPAINQAKINAFKKLVGDSRKPGESLAAFLDRLFPYPVVTSTYEGNMPLIDPRTLDFENQVQQFRVSKYDRVNGNWNLRIGSTGKFKLNQPASWNSRIPLTGNEYLEFVYNPDGQLQLDRPGVGFGPRVRIQNVEIELRREMGSSHFLDDYGIYVQPAFEFWATDNQLTPAPAFSFISATSPTGQQLLIQDYVSNASQSNVRQIVFSELNSGLLDKLGFDENTSLTLNLQESRQDSGWHLLEFYDPGQRFKLFDRKNDVPLELLSEKSRVLDGISGNEDGAYRIELRFDESAGYREYTFSVARTDPASNVPLDCWLIQVIDDSGRPNNRVFREISNDPTPIERVYKFDPDQKLERIEHRFAFEDSMRNSFNDSRKAFFGIRRIDVSAGVPGFSRVTSDQFPDN